MATDSELRGKVLAIVYELRHKNSGWVPISETNFAGGEPVDVNVIRTICTHLGQAGLIEWKPGLSGPAAGFARITAHGTDVFERSSKPRINITLPDKRHGYGSGTYGAGAYGGPHAPQPPDTSTFDVAANIAVDQQRKTVATTAQQPAQPAPPLTGVELRLNPTAEQASTAPKEVRTEIPQETSVTMSVTRAAAGHAQGRSTATAIGAALLQNREAIDLATAGLSILIGDKLQALRQLRLNSPEGRAEIARYEDLQAKLEALREAASKSLSVPTEEEAIVKSTTSFTEALGNWWTKRHVEAFDLGLFVSGVGICSLLGSSGLLVAGICGAIVGGKRVSDMIKAIVKAESKKA